MFVSTDYTLKSMYMAGFEPATTCSKSKYTTADLTKVTLSSSFSFFSQLVQISKTSV